MKISLRVICIISIQVLLLVTAKGQQQPLYSQFTFNRFLFNPGAAGAERTTKIQLAAYEQWVGFKGSPKYHTASFDTRIFEQTRSPRRNIRRKFKLFKPGTVGAGVHLFNERFGTLSNTGFSATYTYHMKMGPRQLSFGLAPVISNMGLRSADVELSSDYFDPAVAGDNTKRWIMDFNFGVYLMERSYFAGYSIHHMSQSALQWGGTSHTDYKIGRQHYIMGGYKYEVSRMLLLEPSMLIKITESAANKGQIDISMKATIAQEYWCGLSFKTSNSLSFFGGLQLDRYFFCYAFDYSLTKVVRQATRLGSHEILLAVQLGDTSKRYRWLNTY